jgi:phenylalanyl-tRNA synthetase alpha chain
MCAARRAVRCGAKPAVGCTACGTCRVRRWHRQVEGVVCDKNVSLGDLIGMLDLFFKKLGIENLRYKPTYRRTAHAPTAASRQLLRQKCHAAETFHRLSRCSMRIGSVGWSAVGSRLVCSYNPYTEPSMEVYSFHPGLNKLVEIGNSGVRVGCAAAIAQLPFELRGLTTATLCDSKVFRPEMLRPMGLPEDVGCIAWGLSLERPTMIKYVPATRLAALFRRVSK